MIIKALANFNTPSHPAFEESKSYFVSDELGKELIDRGLAEEDKTKKVTPQPKVEKSEKIDEKIKK